MKSTEALRMAIDALAEAAEETYEGSEREEDGVKQWIEEREEAVEVLEELYKGAVKIAGGV